MRVEAVIFDLDNTLVNRKLAFMKYTELLIDQFIVTTDEPYRNEIIEYIRVADRDGYRNKRELYEEILNHFQMKNPDLSVDNLMNHWFSEFFKCTVLMDGALEVLEYLKKMNIKLGLITNGSEHSQNLKIDQARIRNFFDTILVSDEVRIKKPDRRIFELALEKLNAKPLGSYYVGDHPINDIQGALDAGLNAIWLDGFMEWEVNAEKPKYIINNLQELKAILEDVTEKPRNF